MQEKYLAKIIHFGIWYFIFVNERIHNKSKFLMGQPLLLDGWGTLFSKVCTITFQPQDYRSNGCLDGLIECAADLRICHTRILTAGQFSRLVRLKVQSTSVQMVQFLPVFE